MAVAVLLIAVVIGVGVWQASRPDQVATPAGAVEDGYGLPVGGGPVTVEVYLDFLCPVCQQFDVESRAVLDEYLADGTITLVYRPIAILDRATDTRFSTRAAAGAACAADADAVDPYVETVLANQPPQGSSGLSDEQIVELGTVAGVTDPDFGACVEDGTYLDWARAGTNAAADRGVRGTPTVFVAGEPLDVPTVEALTEAVDAAVAAS